MSSPVLTLRTAFATYRTDGVIGQGGAGTVYRATDDQQNPVAIKMLDPLRATRDRLKRFKNEYLFGYHHSHAHLLRVIDFGVSDRNGKVSPFYVMPRYAGSLRHLMRKGIDATNALDVFARLLSGVEAAHLLRVTHRDLKPENVMANDAVDVVVGDFGIAHFAEEDLYTAVETRDGDRLANFSYAAPEQRMRGSAVDQRADLFALGLMLNELFTNEVPHGVGYRVIADVRPELAWVDEVVAQLIRSRPTDRPSSIAAIRELMRLQSDRFETRQRLDATENMVVDVGAIEDPIALAPPNIVAATYDGHQVIITLDQTITQGWVHEGLRNMGSHASAWNASPDQFTFEGNQARVRVDSNSAQQVVNHFKNWLPMATAAYHRALVSERMREQDRRQQALRQQRAELERLEKAKRSLTF